MGAELRLARTAACTLCAVILCLATPRTGTAQFFAEAFTGSALSAPLRLSVTQRGEAVVRLRAHYDTRPFEGAPYYAWRVGYWRNNRGWAVGLVHHKLYLNNPPAEIDRFEVSHGYNLVTVTHGWLRAATYFRVGAGAVIAHPEIVVRGEVLSDDGLGGGYFLTGPTLQGVVGRYIRLSSLLALALEANASASRARLPVAGGHANTPNLALHFHLGLKFGRSP